jgi:phage-related protein
MGFFGKLGSKISGIAHKIGDKASSVVSSIGSKIGKVAHVVDRVAGGVARVTDFVAPEFSAPLRAVQGVAKTVSSIGNMGKGPPKPPLSGVIEKARPKTSEPGLPVA